MCGLACRSLGDPRGERERQVDPREPILEIPDSLQQTSPTATAGSLPASGEHGSLGFDPHPNARRSALRASVYPPTPDGALKAAAGIAGDHRRAMNVTLDTTRPPTAASPSMQPQFLAHVFTAFSEAAHEKRTKTRCA